MKPHKVVLLLVVLVAPPLPRVQVLAQSFPTRTNETISAAGARPVALAMDAIEKKYGVLIDYVDPPYLALQDTEQAHYRAGHTTLIPKMRSILVSYTQLGQGPKGIPYLSCNAATLGCAPVDAWPEEGMTRLIQQVLDQFAAQGGQSFLVRKLSMPYGPRWEVYPEEARGQSGPLEYQPDLLGAAVSIPGEQQAGQAKAQMPDDLLGSIFRQLEADWGGRFRVAGMPLESPTPAAPALPSGESVSGWEALARFMGPGWVLRLNYAPDNGVYYPNMARLPYRPPPRPPTPAPASARLVPLTPHPPGYWLFQARTPAGILEIQRALARAGYLRSAPNSRWDSKPTSALRKFQAASGLPSTGKLDALTVLKLGAYLPMYRPALPPKPAVDPALFHWLDSTQPGWMEIQQALTKAGFYSGPITGVWDVKTRAALKAFQKANGITPAQGIFEDRTADKLAPFLPKQEN
ncbi:MAG TPA: peptidoglycan-binding domain-containing protein [Candidatus Acidoferrales bacterium]|nr:peptidoglycan-binding domain-containing protein [Candidatus Acidoferrales bacterium]